MFSQTYLCHRSVHFLKQDRRTMSDDNANVTESIVTEEEGATLHIVHQTSQENGLTLKVGKCLNVNQAEQSL